MALTVAACTQSPPESGEPVVGEVPVLQTAQEVTLPLDAYRPSPEQQIVLANAREILVRSCMADFGFTLPARPPITAIELGPGRRYGVTDAEEAAAYGYHLPPDRDGGSNEAPAPGQQLSEAATTVLSGRGQAKVGNREIPPGGCTGQAERELGGVVEVHAGMPSFPASLAQRLDNEAHHRYLADSRIAEVNERWSQCMRTAIGAEYKTWRNANNDPAWQTGATATDQEITTAKADVRCKHETNLAGISLAVESAYQRLLIEQNAEALQQERVTVDEQTRRSAAVVAGG